MKTRMVYKVVKPHEGFLVSVFKNPFSLTYDTSTYTEPVVGKIFAFNSLKAARSFCCGKEVQIWAATAKISDKTLQLGQRLMTNYLRDMSKIMEFWKRKKSEYMISVPDGTVFCDSIKLLYRVN